MEWRTIDSAPMMTDVLVLDATGIYIAKLQRCHVYGRRKVMEDEHQILYEKYEEETIQRENSGVPATNWMPLPKTPT